MSNESVPYFHADFDSWWDRNWSGKYPDTDARDRSIAENAWRSARRIAQPEPQSEPECCVEMSVHESWCSGNHLVLADGTVECVSSDALPRATHSAERDR